MKWRARIWWDDTYVFSFTNSVVTLQDFDTVSSTWQSTLKNPWQASLEIILCGRRSSWWTWTMFRNLHTFFVVRGGRISTHCWRSVQNQVKHHFSHFGRFFLLHMAHTIFGTCATFALASFSPRCACRIALVLLRGSFSHPSRCCSTCAPEHGFSASKIEV